MPNIPSIFTKGHARYMAHVWFGDEPWLRYASNYWDTAKKIAEDVINANNRFDMDQTIFPIIFLYRHSTELYLKLLLAVCLAYVDGKTKVPKGHSLQFLWGELKKSGSDALTKLGWDKKTIDAHLQPLDSKIADAELLDGDSMVFRYPVDNRGNPMLADNSFINLEAVHQFFEDILQSLDGFLSQLTVEMDMEGEMIAAYIDAYGDDYMP